MVATIVIIFLALFFLTFFSGMKIAFVSANRLKIELARKQGHVYSELISIFTNNPTQYFATMLIGYSIALVLFGIEISSLFTPFLTTYLSSTLSALTLQILAITTTVIISTELLPKTSIKKHSNTLLNLFAIPIFLFYLIFYPVSKILTILSYWLMKVFFRSKNSKNKIKLIFGKRDLTLSLGQSSYSVNATNKHEQELKIFQNALDFSEVRIRDCMIPRTDIEAIEIDESIDSLRQRFIETKYSRIPVYKGSIDDIVGYINSKELFKNPKNIQSRLIKIDFIPETMKANKVLAMFIKEHKSIAVVVDEFGGTGGLVTIEDIIEEIIGEIDDEHDRNEFVEKKINENEFILSGRLEIKHLNETYSLNIPESDEYETLAGFVLFQHQNIPKPNEIIDLSKFTVRVLKMNETRIELVHLTKL